jgi:hypothetical protein
VPRYISPGHRPGYTVTQILRAERPDQFLQTWRLNGQVVEVAFSGVNTHLQSEVDQRKARLPVPNPDVLADLLNKWITVVENNPPTVGIFECLALAEPIWILRMDGRTTG